MKQFDKVVDLMSEYYGMKKPSAESAEAPKESVNDYSSITEIQIHKNFLQQKQLAADNLTAFFTHKESKPSSSVG